MSASLPVLPVAADSVIDDSEPASDPPGPVTEAELFAHIQLCAVHGAVPNRNCVACLFAEVERLRESIGALLVEIQSANVD